MDIFKKKYSYFYDITELCKIMDVFSLIKQILLENINLLLLAKLL